MTYLFLSIQTDPNNKSERIEVLHETELTIDQITLKYLGALGEKVTGKPSEFSMKHLIIDKEKFDSLKVGLQVV